MNDPENNPPKPLLSCLSTEEKRHLLRKIVMGEAKSYVLLKEKSGHQLVEMPVDLTAQMRAIALDNRMSIETNAEPAFTGYRLIIGDEEIESPLE